MKRALSTKSAIFWASAVTAVVACVVCLPVLDNQFVAWDDAQQIYQNSHITRIDGEFFRWAFFHQHGLFWMPLTWLSFAVGESAHTGSFRAS